MSVDEFDAALDEDYGDDAALAQLETAALDGVGVGKAVAPNGMVLARQALKQYWGFEDFRGVQAEVLERLLVQNENACCIMGTGGGKSLTYQIPALCLDGLVLVISPLLSLMKDQTDVLKSLGIAAATLDSTLSQEESAQVRADLRSGALKILYVAPERLNNENFVMMMSGQRVSLLAVDESHCVSEWGASFRPDYLKVARFAQEIGAERVLALTATATEIVTSDICKEFAIDPKDGVFKTGTYRSNLVLRIAPTTTHKSKLDLLVPFLRSRKSGAAIVYVTTQWQVDEVTKNLKDKDIDAKGYHAGMTNDNRKAVQDWFLQGNGCVVATIAFGMGIDKPDVRQVAHYMMPKTLEGYSQEIGRAGRDGLPSECLMLPASSDMPLLESFVRGNTCSEQSIRAWLHEVFSGSIDPADGSLSYNLYEQSSAYDISRNTLGLVYAQLELQFGLMRAVTPFYATYTMQPNAANPTGWARVMADKSKEANAIRKYWVGGKTWHTLDIVAAAQASGLPRMELARCITRAGDCISKVSQVRNRYMPLAALPTTTEQVDEIAAQLFKNLLTKEEEDVDRLRKVAAFIVQPQCFPHGLAVYFGDHQSVPNQKCKRCGFCSTGSTIAFTPACVGVLEQSKLSSILSVCGVRDDPRFLARLAFGISSPRITKLGLNKHPVFESCRASDFSLLLDFFEKECAAVKYVNKDVLAVAPPSRATGSSRGGSSSSAPKTISSTGSSEGRGGYGKAKNTAAKPYAKKPYARK